MPNTLYYGDNLDVLPRIATESVDLIYLDPPFKSDRQYNAIFRTVTGDPAPAQIHAFDDTWTWGLEAEQTYTAITAGSVTPEVAVFMRAMFTVLGKSDMMAYLVMMAPRLTEMRRVMKPTASIYLHCDPTASHYLKLLMDAIFGADNFVNEVVWSYRSGGGSKRHFGRKHDTLLFYGKKDSQRVFYPDAVRVKYSAVIAKSRSEMFNPEGKVSPDVWDISRPPNHSKEWLAIQHKSHLPYWSRFLRPVLKKAMLS